MNVFTDGFLQLLDSQSRDCAVTLSPSSIVEFIQTKTKLINSQVKGQMGENWLYQVLQSKLPECEIIKCASVKWSGDFVCKRKVGGRTVQLMIDVKNYGTVVPKDEIAKFHRDIEVRCYDAGLLLSLNTRFAGEDDDMSFSIATHGGRDVNLVLLTATNETLIIQTIRYLFSIACCDREIKINHACIKSLQDIKTRLAQMSRLRYEIGLLNTHLTTGLSRLSHELLDIEVRTHALLDTIFNNIDEQTYHVCQQETLERDAGVSFRPETLKVLCAVKDEIKISEDKKFVTIGNRAVITRMAAKDKISIDQITVTKIPSGPFTFKDGKLTFDLTEETELAIYLLQS